ncbi:hypothetical protein V6N13_092554 [Hibiscus sabdariffa]
MEKSLQIELADLEKAELQFYQHWAKLNGLTEGDQGNKLFHADVAAKKKKNTITFLQDDQGHRLDNFDSIAEELFRFFVNQIRTDDVGVSGCSVEVLRDLLNVFISPIAHNYLIRGITTEEIKAAIFYQGKDKAPGPDGYTS